MTKTETTKLVALILAGYPGRIQPEQVAPMVEAWRELLGDLDYTAAERATALLCQTREHPPTVAAIRAACAESAAGRVLTGGEAWGRVQLAMRKEGAYRTPGIEFFFRDPLTARCVEIMDWRTLCLSENQVADRARFIELYDSLADGYRKELAAPALAEARGDTAIGASLPRGELAPAGALVSHILDSTSKTWGPE